MPFSDLCEIVLVEKVGEFEYKDGLFYITYQNGVAPIRRCYRPHIFLKSLEMARRAVEQMYAERGNVVEFRAAEH